MEQWREVKKEALRQSKRASQAGGRALSPGELHVLLQSDKASVGFMTLSICNSAVVVQYIYIYIIYNINYMHRTGFLFVAR